MRILMSLILSLALPFSARADETAVRHDDELWQSILDLRERGSEIAKIKTAAGFGIFTAVGAAAALGLYGKQIIEQHSVAGARVSSSLPRTAAGIASLGAGAMALTVAMIAMKRNPPTQSLAANTRQVFNDVNKIMREIPVESSFLRDLARFLSQPLRVQYQAAADNPELRDYLVELSTWMKEGVERTSPPLHRAKVSAVAPSAAD